MKTKYLIANFFICFNIFLCFAQKNGSIQKYYYYKGEKIILNINQNRIAVFFNDDPDFVRSIEKKYTISRNIGARTNYTASQKKSITNGLELLLDDSKKYDDIIKLLKKEDKVIAVEQVVGDTLP